MATPKLRFDGFSGNWVTTQLGNVCSFTQGVQIPQSEQINEERDGYIRYLYIRDFFSDKFKCYVPNIYPEKIIHPHEIMMVNTGNTTGEAYTGRYGVLSNNSFKISYDLAHFNDQFMYLFCSSELAQNQIKKFFNAGGQPHLGHKNISQILISYPKKQEQTKIASFLSAVDEKISQLNQKHELLSQYKQGMMQKLFSQQIRFKADDGSEFGEWKKVKFSDKFKFHQTNSYSRALLSEQGEIMNIHYGDIHTKFSTLFDISKEVVPFLSSEVNTNKFAEDQFLQVGDLVIADASEDYKDIGKALEIIHLNNQKVVAGLHTYIARPVQPFALGFCGYLMQTFEVREQIKKLATGISVLGISKTNIGKVEIKVPCLEEQTKIANFLSAIDQKIEVVAQQIEQAKQWKKGLLQQMFV
ncbi:restriction endonuclease subunit S [Acinetobacter baumannii]|uniref:restriction endonuclease subunit S n=1 Tax=Acinetobacter baumannii TaxID=470 RepID=UPI000D6E79C9|nr:restriction endonuclease subunit S [Acinetobacter baumannii]MDO7242210.1 restriction endonuclease subunit S [Acinetobacter baumannii]